MSTYVLMRILESAPHRYERGMWLLTLGGIDRAYDRLVQGVEPGDRVLDLGCGTGALTRRLARRGARVKGIDIDPDMLDVARTALAADGLAGSVELVESGVADLDGEPAAAYDAVTAGLCFSELSDDELAYTLSQVVRILRPGGRLLVADEVRSTNPVGRWLHAVARAPLAAVAWLLTQQTTSAVDHLPERLAEAGLEVTSRQASALGAFASFVAIRPAERST